MNSTKRSISASLLDIYLKTTRHNIETCNLDLLTFLTVSISLTKILYLKSKKVLYLKKCKIVITGLDFQSPNYRLTRLINRYPYESERVFNPDLFNASNVKI